VQGRVGRLTPPGTRGPNPRFMPAFEHFPFVLGIAGIAAAIPQGCGLHVRPKSRGPKKKAGSQG
jgi:hypothetical protein